jgi:4-aminobutyrate aminotransferase/(S)-3-amino-2-methylpropionate transaminase
MKDDRTSNLRERREKSVPRGPFHVTPYFANKASGALIEDVDGKQYIDFAGGIGVLNVGSCHPRVVAAIKDQAEKYIHTCFHVVMYPPYVELAEKLCALTPGVFPKMALLANSGAEGVENAVKVARFSTGRQGIIAFENAFHGRTLLAMSLTSKVKPYKFGFGPFAPEIYRMPYAYCYRCPIGLSYPACDVACAEYLKDFFITHVAAENTGAIIVEPIQGEGGFITPPPEYFARLHKICRDHGILFIADEIQSGIGRTGRMCAIEHWGVEPDIVILGKSLAAGMPLSAVVGKKEIMNAPDVGALGGTYGGNPICCRAALAVLEVFEEDKLLDRALVLGEKLMKRLEAWKAQYEIIGDIRGRGPMLAMELVKERISKAPATDEAKALVKFSYERGLIIMPCGSFNNVIRFLMPLVISDDQLERGLAIVEEGLNAISKG